MKERFTGEDRRVKPSRLKRMTDDVAFQKPQVPSGLVEKSVSVPWRCAEIPQVRYYKEQGPEEKERCFWICQSLEPASQFPPACCKSSKQKEHTEQPADRLPWVSPSRFTIMRDAARDTDYQTEN